MLKLHILRLLFLVTSFLIGTIGRSYRFLWLYHYIAGSGKTKKMPRKYLEPLMMVRARRDSRRHETTTNGFKYFLHHTLEYEGSGFWGRPEAFYMVGCMTYLISFKRNRVIVSGKDVYDWHPDATGNFHTSGLDIRAIRVLSFFFGSEYFKEEGYPMGGPGISNKMWMDFEKVGSKPFTTLIHEEYSSNEWRAIKRRMS
jgi:hypothetical protein